MRIKIKIKIIRLACAQTSTIMKLASLLQITVSATQPWPELQMVSQCEI